MITYAHIHRHTKLSFSKENRLCFLGTPEGPSVPREGETVVDKTTSEMTNWAKTAFEYAAWGTVELAEGAARLLIKVPVGVAKGIYKGIRDAMPDKEDALAFLHDTAEFFRGTPLVGERMARYFDGKVNYETMKRLVDHRNWIAYFQDNPEFADGKLNKIEYKNPETGNGVMAVADFMNGLSPEEKKKVFMEFVDKYVSDAAVLDSMTDARAGNKALPAQERFKALGPGGVEIMGRSLGTMMGIERAPLAKDEEEEKQARKDVVLKATTDKIASKSLLKLYGNVSTGIGTDAKSGQLSEDYADALNYVRLKGIRDFSPSVMKQNLPPSTLLGALNLGVVNEARLTELEGRVRELQHKEDRIRMSVATRLDNLSGDTEKQLQNEATTFADSWKKASGLEMLAYIAAGIVALKSSGLVRYTAVGAIGFMAIRRFLYNDDSPGTTLSLWTKKGVDAVTGGLGRAAGVESSSGPQAVNLNRANAVVDFIKKFDPEHSGEFEKQAVGMGLLYDIPLPMLAQAFVPTSDGGFRLQAKPGSPIDAQLKKLAQEKGIKDDYRNVFCSASGRTYPWMDDAIGYIFFSIADKMDPASARDVESVQKGLKTEKAGMTPRDLPKLGKTAEFKTYNDLIARGRLLAMQGSQSVGGVIQEVMGISPVRTNTRDNGKNGIDNHRRLPQDFPPSKPGSVPTDMPPSQPARQGQIPNSAPVSQSVQGQAPNAIPPAGPGTVPEKFPPSQK